MTALERIGWGAVISLLLLLAASALFSACETALSSANRMRLRSRADAGDQGAAMALAMAERFDRTLPAILIGNNVVNIAAASAATLIASSLFGATGAAIATVVMTVVILVFGEVLPKSYAKQHAEEVAIATAGLLRLLVWALFPFVWLLTALQDGMSKLFSGGEAQPLVTEQELRTIIETIEEEGVIDEQRSDLVQSALDFDEFTAQDVLTPRVDLVAIDADDPVESALELVLQERYSRIPVYRGTIDHIIGILHTRDLMEAVIRGGDFTLESLLDPPLYIHKTKRIAPLLTELKAGGLHMAVVIDDFGGTLGVVTLEDLLEQLVGEIWDEDEEATLLVEQSSPDTYLVGGDIAIDDAFDEIGLEPPEDSEYSTMGGWALEHLGRIPAVGDSFMSGSLRVTVEAMDEQRVTRLLIHRIPNEGAAPAILKEGGNI